jgi:hypothetical protein
MPCRSEHEIEDAEEPPRLARNATRVASDATSPI